MQATSQVPYIRNTKQQKPHSNTHSHGIHDHAHHNHTAFWITGTTPTLLEGPELHQGKNEVWHHPCRVMNGQTATHALQVNHRSTQCHEHKPK